MDRMSRPGPDLHPRQAGHRDPGLRLFRQQPTDLAPRGLRQTRDGQPAAAAPGQLQDRPD